MDVNGALAVVDAADSANSLEELPALLLYALCRAIGADSAGWVELVDSRPVRYVFHPAGVFDDTVAARFERFAAEFPLARHTRPGGSGRPIRLSDLQSRGAYRASGLYAEVMRPIGVEEILAMSLADETRNLYICISVHRSGSDFPAATVDLLTRLRPLLARRLARLSGARAPLTSRQSQVLALVARGMTDAAIARQLGCSARTIDKHLEHVYRRLGVSCRAAAVASMLAGMPAGTALLGGAPGLV